MKPATSSQTTAPANSKADWQVVTIISNTEYEEVDCNSGDRRRITKSRCACGQPVLIEHDANRGGVRRTCRADGKRVFYPNQPDEGWCVFRCERCSEPIDSTCPDAAYAARGN